MADQAFDALEPGPSRSAAPPKPTDELESVLDDFEAWHVSQSRPDDVVRLAEREAFVRDFETIREGEIRIGLEEVAWRLEQRGHHSWIETSDDSVSSGEVTTFPGAIALRILATGDSRDSAHAPRLSFMPDPAERVVDVEAKVSGEGSVPHAYGRVRVEVLERHVVVDLAVRFVGEVLAAFRRSGGAPAGEATDLEPGAWIPGSDQSEGVSRDWT